jgi:hypothetical protein
MKDSGNARSEVLPRESYLMGHWQQAIYPVNRATRNVIEDNTGRLPFVHSSFHPSLPGDGKYSTMMSPENCSVPILVKKVLLWSAGDVPLLDRRAEAEHSAITQGDDDTTLCIYSHRPSYWLGR